MMNELDEIIKRSSGNDIPCQTAAIRQLGIVFDIDGTLIAEGKRISSIILRPGAVDFITGVGVEVTQPLCGLRGMKLGPAPSQEKCVNRAIHHQQSSSADEEHECNGITCRRTFEFVWGGNKMRRSNKMIVDPNDTGCQWCKHYRHACTRCSCTYGGPYYCSCRYTKDLRKVWSDNHEGTADFTRERTLIVENTPQKCIHNYGNAIYVPTYHGHSREEDEYDDIFKQMKSLIVELEQVDNVRYFQKCAHRHRKHACFEQTWWR